MQEDIKENLIRFFAENEDLSDDSDILYSDDEIPAAKKSTMHIKRFWEEQIPAYSDELFIREFRIDRKLFKMLVNTFKDSEYYREMQCTKAHSPEKHLAVFLWFAGRESCSYRELAQRFDLSLSSVFAYIRRCTRFVSSLADTNILWPCEEEKKEAEEYFRIVHNFPSVIGAIGVTGVRIDVPKEKKKEYKDSAGYTTVCLQAAANERGKFFDVSIGFNGSTNNRVVFRSSHIFSRISELCKGYYLLGDVTYPGSEYVLIPYKEGGYLTPAQKLFNTMHKSVYATITDAFDALKQRFPQLYYCKMKGLEHICHFIRACCVLHNLADPSDLNYVEPARPGYPENIFKPRKTEIYENEDITLSGRKRRNLLAHQFYKEIH